MRLLTLALALLCATGFGSSYYSSNYNPVFSGGVTADYFQGSAAGQALTGIYRLNSTGQICFRNNAGNADVCLSKDTSDILNWTGALTTTETITSGTGLTATTGDIQAVGGRVLVNTGLYLDGGATAFPASATYDSYGSIQRTASGGTFPFDNAGSLVYRTRLTGTAGRSSHYFYTGATPTLALRINETQQSLFSGNVTITPGTGNTALSLVGPSLAGSAGNIVHSASGVFSWLVGPGYTSTNWYEITPSTASGGSTFNFPLLKLSTSGNVNIGHASLPGTIAITGTTTITGSLTTSGALSAQGFSSAVNGTAKTANYTATTTDDVIRCDASGGAFTVTIPAAAAGNAGKVYIVKKIDSDTSFNIVTIGTGYTGKLVTFGDTIKIQSDGTNWNLLARHYPKVWTSYSLTIGGTVSAPTVGTTSVNEAWWMRVADDTIAIKYRLMQTGAGAAGSGFYLFPLPSGLTIDSTKENSTTWNATGFQVGTTAIYNGSAYAGYVQVRNSSNLMVCGGNSITDPNNCASDTFAPLSGATVRYGFTAQVPVTNWQ